MLSNNDGTKVILDKKIRVIAEIHIGILIILYNVIATKINKKGII
jgi:hypothetical protein